MKKKIQLSEQELRRIVKNSVNSLINEGAQFDYNVGMQSLNVMKEYSQRLNKTYQNMIRYAKEPKMQIMFAKHYANIANKIANDIAKLYGM